MAQSRRVFSDLTNTVDCNILKAGSAAKPEAPRSPIYTSLADDLNILEDTPLQSKGDKVDDSYGVNADAVTAPGFQTPQKLPSIHPAPPIEASRKIVHYELGVSPEVRHTAGEQQSNGQTADEKHDNGIPDLVARCAEDLRSFWEESARNGGTRIRCLLQKFAPLGPPRLAAVFFCPPPGAPPSSMEHWQRRGGSQTISNEVSPLDSAIHDEGARPTVERTLTTWAQHHDDIEQRADCTLKGLVNMILRSCHLQSERRLPVAEAVLRNFPAAEREKTLMWLFQVCANVNFHDSVLHMAVLLLDRFCASLSEPINLERLQLVTVAILSISLKMNGAVDENSKPPKLQDLLVHLGQKRYSIQEIFQAEHEVLRFLGFTVSMPSAVDILDTFLIPHGIPGSSVMSSPVRCVATFLLQLSLLDANLHYRYSHAVLAAGAVYMALWCAQRGPEHALALLDDVAVCFEDDAQAS